MGRDGVNNNSLELGRVVPRRLEGKAEVWYWSYMNRKWVMKQKAKARNSFYREPGYGRETPSEYYIRKVELLASNWNTIISTQLYPDLISFQSAIRYHEDALLEAGGEKRS